MMHNYCDLSVENMLSGTRRRMRSKSESEFEDPPVTRDRLGSMRYVEAPVDCLITPSREMFSQPNRNDEFLETPLGLGRSTRLDEGLIQPDWDTIDTDLNYLEYLAKKYGAAPTAQVKFGYDRMLTTLVQTERALQINGQFGDILAVDCRKDRLYKTKLFRVKPIRYEEDIGLVGSTGPNHDDCQEIGPPGIDRGDGGQTRIYSSNAASQVVDRDGQLTAYTPGYSQEIGPLV